jgi:hypothetical protein
MHRYLFVFPLLAWLSGCARNNPDETFHYQTHQGANHQSAGWKTAPSRKEFKKLGVETYDSYKLIRKPDGTTEVQRQYSTPSGDWMMYLRYFYSPAGRLTNIYSELRTFSAIDSKTGKTAPAKCIRHFRVEGTKITKESKLVTDLKSGRPADRAFFDPPVRHWMSLSELPEPAR